MKSLARPVKKLFFIISLFLLVAILGLTSVILHWANIGKPQTTIPSETVSPVATDQIPPTITEETVPGLVVSGRVSDQAGARVEGVQIYRSYASYSGVVIATTDANGEYTSDFYPIPGDEMVTIWAQKPGSAFEPENYYWRHYYGYEHAEYDFRIKLP